jgi:hypothetical protein
MSIETSRTNPPGDGDSDDEHTFGYRSADSAAAVDDDLDDDDELDDDTVSSVDDDDEEDDAPVVQGTVYDSSAADYGTTDSGVTDSGVTDSGVTDYSTPDPDAVVTDVDDPQPTFTPVDDGTVDDTALTDDVPVTDADANAPTLSESDDVPVVTDTATTPVTEAPLSSATDIDPNAPLLGDSVSLRANWQQAQAGFVDDPRAAVADAAELVEHAAQTLIGSLQQRQVALRNQWDNNGSGATAPSTTGELSDTEQLRHLMQDYRNLFNQLVQP